MHTEMRRKRRNILLFVDICSTRQATATAAVRQISIQYNILTSIVHYIQVPMWQRCESYKHLNKHSLQITFVLNIYDTMNDFENAQMVFPKKIIKT